MRVSRFRLAAAALTSGLLLSGCAYDMYGDPYGYDGYGYGYPRSGVSIGIGYGSPYGGYGYGYPYGGYGGYGGYGYPYGGYGGYGYPYSGYGYDPFGWYGSYYYPGSGIYVYDTNRTRRVWSGDQQRYWTQRRQQWQQHSGTTTSTGENWSGWDRHRKHDTSTSAASTGSWTRHGGNWTRGGEQSGATTTTRSVSTDQGGRGRGHRHGDRDD